MLDQMSKIAGIIVAAAILVGGIFWISQLDADVRYVQKDVAKLQDDVTELQRDVAGLQADVAGLQADVAGLTAQVTEVQRNQLLILQILRELAADAQQQPTALEELGGGS